MAREIEINGLTPAYQQVAIDAATGKSKPPAPTFDTSPMRSREGPGLLGGSLRRESAIEALKLVNGMADKISESVGSTSENN